MLFGEKIKQRRLELGYTADKLAELIGKDRSTVFRYENGEIRKPNSIIIEKFAKALDLDPSYLLNDDYTNYELFKKFKEWVEKRNAERETIAVRASSDSTMQKETVVLTYNEDSIEMVYQGRKVPFDVGYSVMSRNAKQSVITSLIRHLKLSPVETFSLFNALNEKDSDTIIID